MRIVMRVVAMVAAIVFSAGLLYADGPSASFSADNTSGVSAFKARFTDVLVVEL